MSEDYYIGLSREQVEKLLKGEEVGKRPYNIREKWETCLKCGFQIGSIEHKEECKNIVEIHYNDTIRIHVRMLTEEEQKKEPDGAFGW